MKPFQVMRLRANASAPAVGLIDSFTTSLWGAYGLVLLRGNYAGSALRIRRSSDNTEQDIGFVGTALDTASMLTFVGSNNGFVTKWYDQSGGSHDMVQATTGSQPQLVDTGAYMGEITLDGVDDHLDCATNSGTPTGFTIHFGGRQRTLSATADKCLIRHSSGAKFYSHSGVNNSNYGLASAGTAGGLVTVDEQASNDETALAMQFDRTQTGGAASQQIAYTNGVLKAAVGSGLSMSGSFTAGTWALGWDVTSAYSHLACKTLLIYEAAQNSTDIGSIAALIKPTPSVLNGLDNFTTSLWGCFSLRHQRTAYAGSCLRVRRSSDNTEQDIGFVGGFLDIASMLTFCGSGNGFVRTWYDQSAGGNNIGQATTGNQPQIVASGVYMGAVSFLSTSYMLTPNNSGTPSGFTTYTRALMSAAYSTTQLWAEHDSGGANNSAEYRNPSGVTNLGVVESSTNKAFVTFLTSPAGQVLTGILDKTLTGSTNICKYASGGIVLTGTSAVNAALASSTFPAKQWWLGGRGATLPAAGLYRDFVIYEAAHAAATVERISRALG